MQQTHHGLFLNCAVRWRSGGDLFTRHISLQNGVDNPIFSADFSVQRQSAGFGGQRGRPGAAGVRNQGPDNNSESSRSPQVKARPRPLGLVNNSPAVLSHRVLCLRISQANMKVLRAFSTFPWSPCDAWASATSAACHRRLLPFAYSPPRPLSPPQPHLKPLELIHVCRTDTELLWRARWKERWWRGGPEGEDNSLGVI